MMCCPVNSADVPAALVLTPGPGAPGSPAATIQGHRRQAGAGTGQLHTRGVMELPHHTQKHHWGCPGFVYRTPDHKQSLCKCQAVLGSRPQKSTREIQGKHQSGAACSVLENLKAVMEKTSQGISLIFSYPVPIRCHVGSHLHCTGRTPASAERTHLLLLKQDQSQGPGSDGS